MERHEAAAKQSQIRHKLLLSFPPFPVRHPVRWPCRPQILDDIYGNPFTLLRKGTARTNFKMSTQLNRDCCFVWAKTAFSSGENSQQACLSKKCQDRKKAAVSRPSAHQAMQASKLNGESTKTPQEATLQCRFFHLIKSL